MGEKNFDLFEHEMETGKNLAIQGKWIDAYRHFEIAHELGHGVRKHHLAAHRAALQAAIKAKHPGRIFYQLFFLGFATLTSRP
ncbi:DUF3703 domain-containing protein [Paenibacillus beijingensis]|uniref:Uncharacterized protein n=1 Tax=Paenibacillus beijingensis TaxID=1126833 RepID=A0A0D5NK89_9BACL|nr:DUF3703 domain-containing protein [Paenibacillus beijingensis]AJY75555.1 hypothetical protein VN24_14520 [Paenibacillus beijingensis]